MEKTKMLELQSNWKKFSEVSFTLLCREMESDTLQERDARIMFMEYLWIQDSGKQLGSKKQKRSGSEKR